MVSKFPDFNFAKSDNEGKQNSSSTLRVCMPVKMCTAKAKPNVSFLTNTEVVLWACNVFVFVIQTIRNGHQQSFSNKLVNFPT